jgi:hypothetical protein
LQFQKTDERLEWMLNNHPDLYVQLLAFPKHLRVGTQNWLPLSQTTRDRVMDYQIARWAAWPQVFFQGVNDLQTEPLPNLNVTQANANDNIAMASEIGNYYLANDPWQHLLSAGPKMESSVPWLNESWLTYVHEQKPSQIDGDIFDQYTAVAKHVFHGEDWYEQSDRGPNVSGQLGDPLNPDYFYRRLFWAALLSGGSAPYGGRFPVIHPYSQTGTRLFQYKSSQPNPPINYTDQLTGLDSIVHIAPFFQGQGIDLADFQPNDFLAADPAPPLPEGTNGPSRPQTMHRSDAEFIVYLPNAADGELSDGDPFSAEVLSRAQCALKTTHIPRVTINLNGAPGVSFSVFWYRVRDGVSQAGASVPGGAWVEVTSPWQGDDAVVHLKNLSQPVMLDPIGDRSVDVGQTLMFTVTTMDADGTASLSASGLPAGATFQDNGNGTGDFEWSPGAPDIGDHPVTFTATDSVEPLLTASETITIMVNSN